MKDFQHGIHLKFEQQEGDVDLHWIIFREYPDSGTASDFNWNKLAEVKQVPARIKECRIHTHFL